MNQIAVLTSGGDSPGMNAALRAVVRTALFEGVKVWGIYNGYRGLLDEEMQEMNSRSVGDIIQRGGTILGTARCKRFMTPEGRALAYENMKKRGIEGLVATAVSEGQPSSVRKPVCQLSDCLALLTMMYGEQIIPLVPIQQPILLLTP